MLVLLNIQFICSRKIFVKNLYVLENPFTSTVTSTIKYPAIIIILNLTLQNFSRTLLKLFREIYYWERLKFEIPHYAAEVYAKEEDLRTLRENVLLVVRDYNRILAALNTEERGLFKVRSSVKLWNVDDIQF